MKFYIDTVIILDYIKNRNTKSIQFLENLKDNNDWIGCTSSFTKLELIDNLQSLEHMANLAIKENKTLDEITRTRNQRNLTKSELSSTTEKVEKFFNRFEYQIILYDLNESGWNRSIELSKLINISAKDLIHLTVAIESKCDFFITNDSDLTKNVKKEKLMQIANPMNLMGLLDKERINVSNRFDEFRGIIVKILESDYESGLFRRCKFCNNVLKKGFCSEHDKVEGYYDLGLSAIAYNGFFEVEVTFEKKDIEKYFDLKLEKAISMATEALDIRIIIDFFERKLKSKFCIINGISDNYGYNIKVTSLDYDNSISPIEISKLNDKWIDETQE